jgi:GR25 family glycosyltransferase involved in LPS biosynthesis
MKTYVINIASRPDRRNLMDIMLRENGFEKTTDDEGNDMSHRVNSETNVAPDLRVEWTTHWDYNKVGDEITDEWMEENGFKLFDWEMDEGEALSIDSAWAKWWSRPLTKGEIGCTLSHWAIWNDDEGPMTILEDDAVFDSNMELQRDIAIETLEVMDKDWDLLYLGRVEQTSQEKRVAKNLVKPNFSYCTYGYVLSKSGVEKIRKYNVHQGIIPADEFLSSTYIAHPRIDVSFKYPPALKAYALKPSIVHQRDFEIVGSDTGLPKGAVK